MSLIDLACQNETMSDIASHIDYNCPFNKSYGHLQLKSQLIRGI